MRKRESGYCMVSLKAGGAFSLRLDQYQQVRAALTKGCKFVDVVGFHGDVGLIPLGVVDGVFAIPAEAVMSGLEEGRADEADDNAVGR